MNNSGRGFEVPMVQVIIVTWNKQKDVTRLLEQLRHINYPEGRFEITVVDNNSTDNTVQVIESDYPWVRLIRNSDNLGGAGGFNTGMRWVLKNRPESKYMWLLDNDVLVDSNALEELVAVMECTPQAGMCGSKVMDIAKPSEIIEAGAYLDYDFGRIRSNKPQDNHDSIYHVDYVAACSLLVRTESVRQLGMLNEGLFIYWDDMEWGARFNASGHKVLAATASIVYHPSWGRRTADDSAVWRSYYRTRNCLWFFNNYTSGLRRRLLLAHIVFRATMSARQASFRSDMRRSRAILRGIQDFLGNNYGPKDFQTPADSIQRYVGNTPAKGVCIFLRHGDSYEGAREFVLGFTKKSPDMKIVSIVPDEVAHSWADLLGKKNVLACTTPQKGRIPWVSRFKIAKFLWNQAWDIMFTSPTSFGMAALFGGYVARIDFDKGVVISVARVTLRDLISIPFVTTPFLVRMLVAPPASHS